MIHPALFVTLLAVSFLVAASQNSSRSICYSGSTLYQSITQDCNSENPSYNGDWYCAKIEVCESFISSQRQCIITRGCATTAQCNGYTNGAAIVQSPTSSLPAGMTITASCCSAYNFPDDDAIAIDYTKICNTAGRSGISSIPTLMQITLYTAAVMAVTFYISFA